MHSQRTVLFVSLLLGVLSVFALGGFQLPDRRASLAVPSNHFQLSSFDDFGRGRLHQAIATLGSQRAVLYLDTDDTLGDNVTVPAEVTLVHHGGGIVDLGSRTLEVNGAFIAGHARVFNDTGAAASPGVRFAHGSVSRVVPQWWGANTSESVQQALDAAVECGAELFLPAGTYVFDTKVEYLFREFGFESRALTIRGAGPGRTVIDNQSSIDPSFSFGTEDPAAHFGWFLTLEGLELTSFTGIGSAGIEVRDVWIGRIANCRVANHAGDGIRLRAELNDLALPKTWTIERSLIVNNGGYGIHMVALGDLPYNVVLDQLDIEVNGKGGIFAAAESMKLTNSIIAYNGDSSNSTGGIHLTGVTGFRAYENLVAGSGFEGNHPYAVYADGVANLNIERNDFSRVLQGGAQPDRFIQLDGARGADNVIIAHNQFSAGALGAPFTAIVGGPGLRNADFDNNVFNLDFTGGDTRFALASATRTTYRQFGDTVLTNQTISFAKPGGGEADVTLDRSGPGMLSVSGGVVNRMQTVQATGGALSIDCSVGLTAGCTLPSDIVVQPPMNATTGAILNLVFFQGSNLYNVSFDPIFKVSGSFNVSPTSFSTIQFVYTGLYWVQLGAASLSAPL